VIGLDDLNAYCNVALKQARLKRFQDGNAGPGAVVSVIARRQGLTQLFAWRRETSWYLLAAHGARGSS
jgi:hypothetical protein